MSRPDERAPTSRPAEAEAEGFAASDGDAPLPPKAQRPSKTQLKTQMHALQDLGEALISLEPRRLDEVAAEAALPERLVEAIREARGITAWGARRRQIQYVGKLMRDVDPEPVRRRLELWATGHHVAAAQEHALEQWRERLLADPSALDALCAAHPQLDRPRFRALIAKARDERARGEPPHAFRELFRALKALSVTRPPSAPVGG